MWTHRGQREHHQLTADHSSSEPFVRSVHVHNNSNPKLSVKVHLHLVQDMVKI